MGPLYRQLNPVSFRWNELHNQKYGTSDDKLNFGFIAQEIEQIFPSFITTDSEGYKWYNPSGFEAILTAGMQELDARTKVIETTGQGDYNWWINQTTGELTSNGMPLNILGDNVLILSIN